MSRRLELDACRFAPELQLFEQLLSDPQLKSYLETSEIQRRHARTRVELLASAIRVDPVVLPRLAAAFDNLLRTGVVAGELEAYVFQDAAVNAFVTLGSQRTLVALSSAAVNNLDERELDFVIGHEVGHVHFGHTRIEAGHLAEVGALSAPTCMRLRAWQRAAEISADRAGLLACGSLEAAASSLFKTVSGLTLPVESFSPHAFAEQWTHLAEEVVSSGERDQWQLSHPFPPLRMKAMLSYWEALQDAEVEAATARAEKEIQRMLAMMDPGTERGAMGDSILAEFFFWGGLYIALADGRLEPGERERLAEVAPADVDVSEAGLSDRYSSEAIRERFEQGLRRRRRKLTAVELHRIIYGLIDVAAADGDIADDELARLVELGAVLGVGSQGCELIVSKYKKEMRV